MTFFSIVIDETTDVSTKSQLAIMVQYWDEEQGKLCVELLDMVELTDGTAEGLVKAVLELLEKHEIPINRYVPFRYYASLI